RNLLETDLDTPISFQSEFELVSYG
ncbi:endonuclease, partial [Vibrio parahaemolyticus]|nr:endonuclease [Vibrio parahaemolyticus]